MLPTVFKLLIFSFIAESWVLATLAPAKALDSKDANKPLSRKRRYIAFPDGSSVAVSICLTIGVVGNPQTSYFSWAENWGVAYNLPNTTWAKQHAHGFKNSIHDSKEVIRRRYRRDLYEKIETIIDNMGYDGHACIERALCESSIYLHQLQPQRGNMIMEMVKTIFSLPTEPVYAHEPEIVHQYDRVFRRARRDSTDCSVEYAQCQFSLIELAFGKYTVEPTKHGTNGRLRSHAFSFM